MKLGLMIGYSGGQMDLPVERVQRAEKLGYHSGVDGGSLWLRRRDPLAFLAAKTERIKLGTAIMLVSARHAVERGHVRGDGRCHGGRRTFHRRTGRLRAADRGGLVWPSWGSPYYWLKDYVEIMRKVFRRKSP